MIEDRHQDSVLIGGNLILWKSKKQNDVVRSSADAEYPAMALMVCELIWVKQLIQGLKFCETGTMKLICED